MWRTVPDVEMFRQSSPNSPKGLPRCAERRRADSSWSVSASFTLATQFGNRGIGQAESKAGSGSTGCNQRHSELQRQASARGTSSARKAFRSTCRQTVRGEAAASKERTKRRMQADKPGWPYRDLTQTMPTCNGSGPTLSVKTLGSGLLAILSPSRGRARRCSQGLPAGV